MECECMRQVALIAMHMTCDVYDISMPSYTMNEIHAIAL